MKTKCVSISISLFVLIAMFFLGAKEGHATATCRPLPQYTKIDDVWGGVRTIFSALETARFVLIAYYDADRWLSVSRIDKCTGAINKIRVNSQFKGWDGHNYIVLYSEPNGMIHLAGNMHGTPLVYSRTTSDEDLDALKELRSMVGSDEDQVTYPRFFNLPSGELGFFYRDGGSGNGRNIIDKFDGHVWQRVNTKPLFAGESWSKVSAYPTEFVVDKNGYYHVAWVWRASPAVETGFNVNHARTKNFIDWEDQTGKKIDLPFTPANSPVVDAVPQGHGLINDITLTIDNDNRPVIAYLKFDSNGFSQLYHARFETAHWAIYQSSNWKYRWDPRGAGAIPMLISFSGFRDSEVPEESILHPDFGLQTALYDRSQLRITGYQKKRPSNKGEAIDNSAVLNPNEVLDWKITSIPVNNVAGQSHLRIEWGASSTISRDVEHQCVSRSGQVCRFIFSLLLMNPDTSLSTK